MLVVVSAASPPGEHDSAGRVVGLHGAKLAGEVADLARGHVAGVKERGAAGVGPA